MRQAKLLVDPLLVGIDGLRADEKLLPDFRGTETAGDIAEHVTLALGELLVFLPLVGVF